MTKQEIEKAIENDECVWYTGSDKVIKIDFSKKNKYDLDEISIFDDKITILVINFNMFYSLKFLFKTKTEAEHYLHHANISRTETLPFLTWEEFLEKKAIHFIDNKGIDFVLRITDNKIKLMVFFMVSKTWDLTEANFYKAYDECVRLFRR